MKKYNLSKIMKRAWELVKKAGLCISEGLKKAWKEAKHMGEITKGSVKQIAKCATSWNIKNNTFSCIFLLT